MSSNRSLAARSPILKWRFNRDFDRDLNVLMVDVLPSLLAPKGSRARSKLGTAFQRYYENFDPEKTQCAAMTKARYTSATKYGFTTWNQGRLEVGTLLGILANTIPSTFYMLVHIYSDPKLLQDVRDELEVHSISTSEEAARILHVASISQKCHLLSSIWQEMLRLHAQGASSRFVLEDTLLDGRYLLKKDMMVQMPMAVMHSDPAIWGDDASSFQPRRFMKHNGNRKVGSKLSAAYRPFGGGVSMCPGRHLVTLEAIALVAYLVLQFDMIPSGGQWVMPTQRQQSLATNVFPPSEDIKVKIFKRRGYEDVQWGYEID